MKQNFKSVKIDAEDYDAFIKLCAMTGHKIGFHLKRAHNNYLKDEGPIWEQAARDMESKLRRK